MIETSFLVQGIERAKMPELAMYAGEEYDHVVVQYDRNAGTYEIFAFSMSEDISINIKPDMDRALRIVSKYDDRGDVVPSADNPLGLS